MKRYRSTLIATVAILSVLPLTVARAAPPRLPASLYPAGAHITYHATLSNQKVDCLWGFLCDGTVPLFHSRPQDSFHRTGGWGQFAGLHRHGRMVMAFQLFASTYAPGGDEDGVSWAAEAYGDLRAALQARGYHQLHGAPTLLPRDKSGAWTADIQRCADADLVVMAAWTGTQDTEAIVMFDHRSHAARATAISLLAAQVEGSMSQ